MVGARRMNYGIGCPGSACEDFGIVQRADHGTDSARLQQRDLVFFLFRGSDQTSYLVARRHKHFGNSHRFSRWAL
jgi:hypothetical protein